MEALLPSGKNQIEDPRSSDMVFLHCNLQLQSLVPHEFDPMKDWILNDMQNDESINGRPLHGEDITGN